MDCTKHCELLAAATGVPISLFENGKLVAGTESSGLAQSILEHLAIETDGVFYTTVADCVFCATVRNGNLEAMVGPIASYKITTKLAEQVLVEIGRSVSRRSELFQYFREKPLCGLLRFRDVLKLLGSILNMEENPKSVQLPYKKPDVRLKGEDYFPWEPEESIKEVEDIIMFYVETGNVEAISNFVNDNQSNHQPGVLADDALRSIKNTFIMTASILSRAAIRGGLDHKTAIWVQSTYLFSVEDMQSYNEVLTNLTRMFIDFTSRVAENRMFPGASPPVTRACQYINSNIRTKVSTSDVASAIGYNRSYLCREFKRQTNMTISEYTLSSKIDLAKKLMEYTDKTLAEISYELGFSSQSYFHLTFKKITGESPGSFRAKKLNTCR